MSTTVRIAIGPVQERVERRTLVVGGILSLFVLAFSLFSIMSGPMDLSFRDVVTAVLGSGESTTVKVVQSVRLPRVITAIAVGMALGASGCVFQSVDTLVDGCPCKGVYLPRAWVLGRPAPLRVMLARSRTVPPLS